MENIQQREEKRKKTLAKAITEDFESRQKMRKSLERGWELNLNFVSGNQFCDLSPAGELQEEDASFYWQSRRAFNYIAPTIETRMARLSKVRPSLEVRAFSDSESDLKIARLCSNILRSLRTRIKLDEIISSATLWSETCGTAFYKVVWNYDDGAVIGTDPNGHSLKEGDVNVVALSPFEVYPDCLTAESMSEVRSIIHAKAVPVYEIKERFGITLPGRRVTDFSLAPYTSAGGWRRPSDREERPVPEDHEILIERYTRPNGEYPQGRLEIVAGGVLLYEGSLPYLNGDRGERVFPFVRQVSIPIPGSFYGVSVVDRMIPLQRAYNAVRNRKHEFLNRLSMGVVAVEDGSVDADELAEEGLYPGKVLVYRQGSPKPDFLDCGKIPNELAEEEERIANEFIFVSGTSEISRSSATPANVTSAVGLQLLIDQDTARMTMSVQSVDYAVKEVGKQILHLYKQFASAKRILRMTGSGGDTEWHYFDGSDISADDIEFEAQYERSAEQKKEEILSLLSLGLLKNADGTMSDGMRNRVLEALGYGSLHNARDISHLHVKKAERENVLLASEEVEADEYDDHDIHVTEHTRALLSGGEADCAMKERVRRHIRSHQSKKEKKYE